MVYRISSTEFDSIVLDALEKLAPEFRERLQIENVDIVVEPEPTPYKIAELGINADEALFGISEGVSLADGGYHSATMPSKITIFQKPIEEAVANSEDLKKEITKTVWHEVGHFLGFDEDEVVNMGLG